MSRFAVPLRAGLTKAVLTITVLLAAAGLAALTPTTPAGAQNAARIDLEAQTLFVETDPAEIVLRLSAAPEGARLHFIIYNDPARTRADVRDQHRNPPTGGPRIADFDCTLDGDCRGQAAMTQGPDGIVAVTLDDTVIGESLRTTATGALPFVVELRNDDGEILDELATSLIVLDDEAPSGGGAQRVQVAFTSQIGAPLALQPDGRITVDAEQVLAEAASLAAHPDLEITTEIRPETLDALATDDPEALDELLDLVGGRPVMHAPWVDLDEEAWRRAGESDQVRSQYAIGAETLNRVLGSDPTGLVRLDPDAGPATLSLLRASGAEAVLVADDQLGSTTLTSEPTQPLVLLDDDGEPIPALRFDEGLHETLDEDDPELAAYRALAELAVSAIDTDDSIGVLLDLDRIDTETVVRLLDGIASRRVLDVVGVEELTGSATAADADATVGTLVPTPAPDVSELASTLETTTLGVATLARMIEPEFELIEPLVTQLQAAVANDLTPDDAQVYVAGVAADVAEFTSGFEIPDGDRITLTDRRTDLPLTIVNPQPFALNVELLLTAEKIRFPGGDQRDLVLQPGENVVTIPVETLASGDARVTVTLLSPGGFLELGTGSVDIRSTAISGLGLVISIVALLVLGVWWIRTIRRVRRNRSAATVSAESAAATPSASPPTEGES